MNPAPNADDILKAHSHEAIERNGLLLFNQRGALLVIEDCKSVMMPILGLDFFRMTTESMITAGQPVIPFGMSQTTIQTIESADFSGVSAIESLRASKDLIDRMFNEHSNILVEIVI